MAILEHWHDIAKSHTRQPANLHAADIGALALIFRYSIFMVYINSLKKNPTISVITQLQLRPLLFFLIFLTLTLTVDSDSDSLTFDV